MAQAGRVGQVGVDGRQEASAVVEPVEDRWPVVGGGSADRADSGAEAVRSRAAAGVGAVGEGVGGG